MRFKDYYQILGIAEDADLKQIKKAYKKLAIKLHPDVNPVDDGGEKFKEIAQAYKVLKDPKLRAEYDELRKHGGARSHDEFNTASNRQNASSSYSSTVDDGDFSDFFNSIFGEQSVNNARSHSSHRSRAEQFSQKGQDAEIDISISLEETLSKTEKTIQFSIPSIENGKIKQINKTLKVNIPFGVLDNSRIRLKGQGGPGIAQGANGDLYLNIKLKPHPLFDVQAYDLILTIPVSPWEAAIGADVTIPTLNGKVKVNIKPNSQTGQKLRLKGKGLKGKSITGDLIGVLKIVIPSETTESDKILWQKFKSSSTFDPRKNWSN